jgi:4-hydroxy-3-methylbut-2-enyl diphosphate reductase IspH
MLTSGASCPDSSVDAVLRRVLELFPNIRKVEDVLKELTGEEERSSAV